MESWKTDLLDKQKRSTRKYRCSWGQCNSDSRYYICKPISKFSIGVGAEIRALLLIH